MPALKLTRRTFIAGTGALLAAQVAAACTAPATTAPAAPTTAPAAAAPATTAPGGAGAAPPTTAPAAEYPIKGTLLTDKPADAGEREVQQVVYNTPLDYGGGQITAYGESPIWAEKVAKGELPPVDERLPVEPVVVKPEEGIGLYGGYMTIPILGETLLVSSDLAYLAFLDPLTNISPQGDTIPNIVQSWTISEDGKQIALNLRKGLRWSDGEAYTANDLLFWYEKVVLNKDLTPTPSSILVRSGDVCQVVKVDDFTVQFTFAAPYGLFVSYLGRWGGPRGVCEYCEHYMKQYHPDFVTADAMAAMMKQEKFEQWTDFFSYMNNNNNPAKPSLYAWLPNERPPQPIQTYTRNPYYWKVDIGGNQLPYIDEMRTIRMADSEAILLKTIAGELDWPGGIPGGMANLPMLKEYQQEVGYRFAYGDWMPNAFCNIMFNFSHPEKARKKLYNDVRFRQALSTAIDREELIKLIWKGGVYASQVAPHYGPPYHGESDMFKVYTQFDPDLANSMLDEIGLTARGSDGFRLGLDGNPMLLVISATTAWPVETPEVMELVRGYWAEVGINATVTPEEGTLWNTRHTAGEHDISSRGAHFGGGPVHPTLNGNTFCLSGWQWAPQWALWMDTNGAQGVEPPEGVKKIREIREQVLGESDKAKQDELIMQVFQIQMDNLWSIGLVVDDPGTTRMVVVHNRIRNVPTRLASFEYHPNVPQTFFVNEA